MDNMCELYSLTQVNAIQNLRLRADRPLFSLAKSEAIGYDAAWFSVQGFGPVQSGRCLVLSRHSIS